MAPSRKVTSNHGHIQVSDPESRAEYEIMGNCPVQAFGTVDGRELYFRARHEAWWFEVADEQGVLPSDGGDATSGFYREDDYSNAGWMPYAEAVRLIDESLREYLRRRGPS